MLFTLTGPSAVGKTSIMKRLLKEVLGAQLLRSSTTRGPRGNEAEGEYLCISQAEFDSKERADAFAWTADFGSARYGTLKSDLRLALASDNPRFAAIVPSIIPKLHAFASIEGFATRVRSIHIKSPGRDILLRRLTVDRDEPKTVAMNKIEECASWDRVAFNPRPRLENEAYGWRPLYYYYFVSDRDDLDEKYLSVLKYVRRP